MKLLHDLALPLYDARENLREAEALELTEVTFYVDNLSAATSPATISSWVLLIFVSQPRTERMQDAWQA